MFERLRQWFRLSKGVQSTPGNVLTLVVRGVYAALIIRIATGVLYYYGRTNVLFGLLLFGCILLVGVAVLVLDALSKNKQITTISAVFFGLLMGFFLSDLFWTALDPIITRNLDTGLIH